MRILFWFRKDLRLDDNTGLAAAARDAGGEVVPFYASEPAILGRPDIAATRVRFVLDALESLSDAVAAAGSSLALDHGEATETVVRAAKAANADAVYWNDEYEPALVTRDAAVEHALRDAGIGVKRFHDRLLVAPGAVRNGAGDPFVVYTPFRKACERLEIGPPHPLVTRLAPHALRSHRLASLEQLGFATDQEPWPGGVRAARARLDRFLGGGLAAYGDSRDFPARPAVSRLSADLKFGTLGVRTVARAALEAAREEPRLRGSVEKYVSELRWRDFYAHVLWHFPHCESGAFRREYDALRWAGDPAHLDAWREGRTGYPIVDAAMRELAATGLMHNRCRMVVASFLTKDLLLDWRLGERHFMNHLVDGDLASNNGGWQWAAGTGTDAQPWFRVFNPVLQGEKFDPEGVYTRRWLPELARVPDRWLHRPWEAPPLALAEAGVTLGETYPHPMVDHAIQRDRALAMFREVRSDLALEPGRPRR
jgi:deoxyribodipyrimidine photo-lyase